MLATLLTFSGHETCTANDGLAAVDAAANLQPDVIFMDLGLPFRRDLSSRVRARVHTCPSSSQPRGHRSKPHVLSTSFAFLNIGLSRQARGERLFSRLTARKRLQAVWRRRRFASREPQGSLMASHFAGEKGNL